MQSHVQNNDISGNITVKIHSQQTHCTLSLHHFTITRAFRHIVMSLLIVMGKSVDYKQRCKATKSFSLLKYLLEWIQF